jgi:parallel beta-helix repeat protein
MNSTASKATAAAALLLCSSGLAANLYVSPTGNDGTSRSANTQATPWRTIQRAVSASGGALPGDVVYVRAGTYAEFVNVGVSGTASQRILVRNYPGELVFIDPLDNQIGSGREAAVLLRNRSYVTIQGFVIQGLAYTGTDWTPVGIGVRAESSGTCVGVQIRDNIVRKIYQNSTDTSGNRFKYNAHGIKVFALNPDVPMTDLVIDGNDVGDLRLGASEAVSINGNISNFRVTRNKVHHCNNIGIDIIGYEFGSLRARNGLVAENLVYNVDSAFNPAYQGNPTTGGGFLAAAGIYVDGGTNCILERNHVHHCNFGIEVASESEAAGAVADFITVRNNLLRHNDSAGLIMGGYEAVVGAAENNKVLNNTFYENGQRSPFDGQIYFQHEVRSNVFRNNLFVTRNGVRQMFYAGAAFGAGNVFSHNHFYVPSGQSPTFDGVGFGLGATDSTGNPQFMELAPTQASSSNAYKLRATSPAVNSGDPAFVRGTNEQDYYRGNRVNGGLVDKGADEF